MRSMILKFAFFSLWAKLLQNEPEVYLCKVATNMISFPTLPWVRFSLFPPHSLPILFSFTSFFSLPSSLSLLFPLAFYSLPFLPSSLPSSHPLPFFPAYFLPQHLYSITLQGGGWGRQLNTPLMKSCKYINSYFSFCYLLTLTNYSAQRTDW